MLTDICQYLRNWFDRNQPKLYGTFTVENGEITGTGKSADGTHSPLPDVLKTGQYIRIVGSVFNDGVHTFPNDESLEDETFTGAVWGMAIPKAVIAIADDIKAWQSKYGGADSVAMSPFQSESFGGYSYSKGSGARASGGSGVSWMDVFARRLSQWRKI